MCQAGVEGAPTPAPPAHPLVCIICKLDLGAGHLRPLLGVWPVSHSSSPTPLAWGCPEQGHSLQEGAGFIQPGLRCRDHVLGTVATLCYSVSSPLTTEEVVDDGVGSCFAGIHQPVGESEAGIDRLPGRWFTEHPKHPRTRGQDTQKRGVCVCVLSAGVTSSSSI